MAAVVEAKGKEGAKLIDQCALLEKKVFPKHEVMDVVREAKKRNVVTLCAVCGGTVVGYLLYSVRDSSADLIKLAVSPDSRRKGYGDSLLAAGLVTMMKQRLQTCKLHVAVEGRDPARSLYAKHGFTTAQIIPSYYREGRDAAVMERTLV
eukprot:TRINITY_DN16368_c0_g1_i1.p1 TRINITY_DN16368_c0_g1~~TRINITY_DN16368_c0_g1_i1.p1  ORF type:complete len:163 (+),score=45.06 TRINITY_DN16368_c0_g1_i1:42-491(+)